MDASNPDHIEQFKKDLHFHEKQKLCASDEELVIGYPKTIVNPELLDEDMLKRMKQPTEEIISNGTVTLDEHKAEDKLTTKTDDDTEQEMTEEETHHVVKKQLDYGAPGDLQENTVEDSIHTVVKRHENLGDIGVDIIEETETIEKVTLTQPDFSESRQMESTESPQHEAQTDIKHDDNVLKVAPKTLDVKTVLESVVFEEDVKIVDEVVKDITEELRKENELVSACIVVDKDKQHLETLSSTEQSEIKETAEVIAGLSDDEKPIISGIVEEVKNVVDNTMEPLEHTAEEQENTESRITENEKHTISESAVGLENYDVDENVVEEVMRREMYAVSEQMTKSFMEDSMALQTELLPGKNEEQFAEQETGLLPGKGDEHFADASEFQDTEINHKITRSTDEHEQDHLQDHSIKDVVEAHVPKGITEAYISKDITEDYIPEIAEEVHFLERTEEIGGAISLTSNDFHDDNMDNGVRSDLRSEKTILKDMTADDHIEEYPVAKSQHLEGFLKSEIDQPGWDELSGEVDNYKVSSATYSTLFGSTLVSGNGGTLYDEYHDDHSITKQSPKETYHNEIYEIPSVESKDTKNTEKLSNEEVDMSQAQQESSTEFVADKSLTDNTTTPTHRHGLTGFISSTLSDSVQNLITSTKNKFDVILGESDGKQQPDLQFTTKTEKMMEDDGVKYEVHTESYAVSSADNASLLSGFGDSKAFLADDSDKFEVHDDNLTSGSTDVHHSTKTTITTTTLAGQASKELKEHRDDLFGDKKCTDELDFEFIH